MFAKRAFCNRIASRAFSAFANSLSQQLKKTCQATAPSGGTTRGGPFSFPSPSSASLGSSVVGTDAILDLKIHQRSLMGLKASRSVARNFVTVPPPAPGGLQQQLKKENPTSEPSKPESKSNGSNWFQVAMIDQYTRAYDWVDREAEILIAKSYSRHKFGTPHVMPVTNVSLEDLEKLGYPYHYEPKTFVDYIAYGTMRFLRLFTHLFFRDRYDHHALILETVAAVPGIVGAAFRHLRSLRWMERDNGWINPLQEEAENERMHLLIWMKFCQPTMFERFLVILAQVGYLVFYSFLYAFSPRSAHRMVGYLEEEAHLAYTAFLQAVDEGKFVNAPAPDIAINYYRLPPDAKLRDVILHVRADECMHRDFNHMLADKHKHRDLASPPYFPGTMRRPTGADRTVYPHEVPRPDGENPPVFPGCCWDRSCKGSAKEGEA